MKTGMQDSVITETWTWKTEKETERRSEEHVFYMVFGIIDIAMIPPHFGGEHLLRPGCKHVILELCGSHRNWLW